MRPGPSACEADVIRQHRRALIEVLILSIRDNTARFNHDRCVSLVNFHRTGGCEAGYRKRICQLIFAQSDQLIVIVEPDIEKVVFAMLSVRFWSEKCTFSSNIALSCWICILRAENRLNMAQQTCFQYQASQRSMPNSFRNQEKLFTM